MCYNKFAPLRKGGVAREGAFVDNLVITNITFVIRSSYPNLERKKKQRQKAGLTSCFFVALSGTFVIY